MATNTLEQLTERQLEQAIGEVGVTYWKAPADMSFDDWQRVGNTLQTISGSINWWIGDWLNEGEQRWGEMYAQAVECTGWDYQRLSKAKWVASKVEICTRVQNLSWTHHREVVDLEPDKQRAWLDVADQFNWSTRQLSDAIKESEQLPSPAANGNGHKPDPLPSDYDEPAEYLAALYSADGDDGDASGDPSDSFDQWTPPPAQEKMAIHYSSDSDDWETPLDLFAHLDYEFGFVLDVCATPENAKCQAYFTRDDDGLKQDWRGVCWMNPPYGNEIGKWVAKAHKEARKGSTVVCLVPARTDTSWWWEHCIKGEVRFIKGRLRFGNAENSAPFPSAVVVFYPEVDENDAQVIWWGEYR